MSRICDGKHGGRRRSLRPDGRRAMTAVGGVVALLLLHAPVPYAQSSTLPIISSQKHHTRGQGVVPLYRGWFKGNDGRMYAAFEYLNRNSAETLDIPIGPDNTMTPGPADQGQPTHFLPGHQHGVFAVPVPDGVSTEITWTLRLRGETLSMPSNLGTLYEIEGMINHGGSYPGNTPPVVRFTPDGQPAQGPAGVTTKRNATVDQPVPLELWITDDGLPPPPDHAKVIRSLQQSYRRSTGSARGVTVTWTKYRGPGTVSFPDQAPTVEQGRASTAATFAKPGEYMLRALISDGSGFEGCCWTNSYVTVTVRTSGQ